MKYHLITYGCQMNTADSEEMAQPLQARGFTATESLAEADVAIMNTCTVREHAEHKALSNLGRLREWKAERPERLLIVAGCAASLWGESVKKKFPYVDLVSPATQIEKFPALIEQALKDRTLADTNAPHQKPWGVTQFPLRSPDLTSSPAASGGGRTSPFYFGSEATAFVTIMRGCNLNCSYCIVPQVRGREKYRAMPDILEEIRTKAAQGYREVMLLGQTVNSYFWRREDSSVVDFSDLLRAVEDLDGVECIRFMSPHPKHMRPRTIDALRDSKKVARHIHLPLQSGSDAMLAQMKRLYTREEYGSIVSQLREAMPGVSITTDVIVGYPGETMEDFHQTLSLLQDIKFNGLFAFKYSPRPGTDSAALVDDVNDEEKERRHQEVLALNDTIKEAYARGANTGVSVQISNLVHQSNLKFEH